MIAFRNVTVTPLLAILFLAALPLPGQTGTPVFNSDPTVHDPSVIHTGDRWYVYGSHGASAWTEDLMNWTQVATSVYSGNPPHFTNFKTDLSELVSWTNADSLWAPDVIQLDDGKFYYYYCVWTNYYNYRSYLGVAVADNIEGPYTHKAEILKGGTGISGFNPSVDPNTIDPTLFWDAEGKLQMVYGSYSGGIFIMEMDPETGLQLPNQSWGTHLWGGSHGRIEGPFIIYNPETEYYYLFVSYYGLDVNDGYNIRVARSRNPDGPYLDLNGADMVNAKGSDSSIAPYGVKLMGGYRFVHLSGEPGSSATGYLSPGHCSVDYDAENNKYYLFFHTRFLYSGNLHQVRVHQIYFNEDGWPVVAPHRYAGETRRSYPSSILSGTWKLVDHSPKTRYINVKDSVEVTLNANGTVSGTLSGTWTVPDGRDIRLTLGGTQYRGVLSHQWDFDNGVWVICFSALSSDGVALWGSQKAVSRSSLETWRLIHFGSAANTGDGSDTADPNGNDIPNLMEYATQADPLAFGNPGPVMNIVDGKIHYTFRRIMDPGLTYTIFGSGDLKNHSNLWSSSGSANSIDTVEYEDSVNVLNSPRRFIQLGVSR